ncbi:membrane protein insertion efficiency factor YidD [bacterium]|nr:membrane protein insertion efficiency factor YidD [bacterium]
MLIASIDAYKATVAPHVPSRCPFTPTCSVYARRAIEKYGAVKGALLAVWRVMRCSPLTKTFGVDEP